MRLQILVPVHTFSNGNSASLARHAAAIARHLDADVNAVVFDADFPRVSSAMGSMLVDVPALLGGTKAKCRECGSAVLESLETELGQLNIPLRASRLDCFPAAVGDNIARLARYYDLVLLGMRNNDDAMKSAAELTIFGSGKPILLVLEDAPAASFEHIMIAWDGSRVAARAVADARDFLQRAQTTTVCLVTNDKTLPGDDLGSQMVEYLSRHQIVAKMTEIQTNGQPIAEALQQHAKVIGADMMVMGGYGHSRFRDFVLGSATSGILKNLRLPVLLSH